MQVRAMQGHHATSRNVPVDTPLSLKTFKRQGVIFWHLFRQTLSSYDSSLPELPALTRDNPKGSIQKEQVELCRLVYDTEEHRREKLEEKSTAALSVAAVLTPFIVSAAVYMASSNGFGVREREFALVVTANLGEYFQGSGGFDSTRKGPSANREDGSRSIGATNQSNGVRETSHCKRENPEFGFQQGTRQKEDSVKTKSGLVHAG